MPCNNRNIYVLKLYMFWNYKGFPKRVSLSKLSEQDEQFCPIKQNPKYLDKIQFRKKPKNTTTATPKQK